MNAKVYSRPRPQVVRAGLCPMLFGWGGQSSRGVRRGALLGLLAALGIAGPGARAALEVDFVTNRGTITATLEYAKAPKAVANLLTLAQGQRGWVDSRTGKVLAGPFFSGQNFFRVVNQAGEKLMETGSAHGDPADEPGFGFPDEFDTTLEHDPYVLSMSNRGPNTNGARFVITGNTALPLRDGLNTVFGRITAPASRAVVDAALAAGAGATILTAVAFRRTDGGAMAFDETAVPLPMAHGMSPQLRVVLGVGVDWLGVQPACSVLRAFQSVDLKSWSPHYRNFVGLDDPLPLSGQRIDGAGVPSRFYYFSMVTYPDACGVSGMGGKVLTLTGPGFGTLVYRFDQNGAGGSYENIVDPEFGFVLRGNFLVSALEPPLFEPHAFRLLLSHEPKMGDVKFVRIRAGLDSAGAVMIAGHHQTLLMLEDLAPMFEDVGSLQLTRP